MSVKKKVKDMNETLSSLVAEIQSLRETVDSQFVEICQLNRNTERLLKENRRFSFILDFSIINIIGSCSVIEIII